MNNKNKLKIFNITIIYLIILYFVSSCHKGETLKRINTQLCGQRVHLEIADTSEKRKVGLMGRTRLDPGTGMVFIFEQGQVLEFWMKNVPNPLSIGYFDKYGRLLKSEEMVPESSAISDANLRRYSSVPHLAKYAVEMPENWFKNIGSPNSCILDLLDLSVP